MRQKIIGLQSTPPRVSPRWQYLPRPMLRTRRVHSRTIRYYSYFEYNQIVCTWYIYIYGKNIGCGFIRNCVIVQTLDHITYENDRRMYPIWYSSARPPKPNWLLLHRSSCFAVVPLCASPGYTHTTLLSTSKRTSITACFSSTLWEIISKIHT